MGQKDLYSGVQADLRQRFRGNSSPNVSQTQGCFDMLSHKSALLMSLLAASLLAPSAQAATGKEPVFLFNNDVQKKDGKTTACGIVLVEGIEATGETLKFEAFTSGLQNGNRASGFIVNVGKVTGGTPPVQTIPLEAAVFSPIGPTVDARAFSAGKAGDSFVIQTSSAEAGAAAYQAFLKGGYRVMAKETGSGRIHQFDVPAKPADQVIAQNAACLQSLGK